MRALQTDKLPAIAPADYAGMFLTEQLGFTCIRPDGLEDYPDLPQRLRGALGHALKIALPPGPARPDPFGRPHPFALLFEEAGGGPPGSARPMTIEADIHGTHVDIRLRLFGGAAYHIETVGAAMTQALIDGISLRAGGRMHAVFTPLSIERQRILPPDVPRAASPCASSHPWWCAAAAAPRRGAARCCVPPSSAASASPPASTSR
jgi:hypothetical protein